MYQEDHEPDPFSSQSLWRLSRFSIEALQPLEALPWNSDLSAIPKDCFQGLPEKNASTDPIWKLNLFSSDLGSPDSIDSVVDPSIDSESDAPEVCSQDPVEENDIWALNILQDDTAAIIPLKSWEKFLEPTFQEPVSAYFSESGAKGFDAALVHKSESHGRNITGRLVQENVFIRCLLRLGLGWSSPFFRYNQQTMAFEQHLQDIRVSGVSQLILNSIIMNALQCGTNMQRMRTLTQNSPTKTQDLSSVFSLRGAIAVIIYNLEHQISAHSSQIVSLLQTTILFTRCGDLVGALVDIAAAAEKANSDAQVISTVMERATFLAQKYDWMENLVQEIVARVTSPWFGFVEGWIGLRSEESALNELISSDRTFVRMKQFANRSRLKIGPSRVQYTYDEDHMPSFIPVDQAQIIFESGRSLRLLKKSHPNHPIARHDVISRTGALRLVCATTWAGVDRIQQKAFEYEGKLRVEILKYLKKEPTKPMTESENYLDHQKLQNHDIVKQTFELFDINDENIVSGSAMDQKALASENVGEMLQRARNLDYWSDDREITLGPEMVSALYLSIAPVISSQAQLIDFSCLHHLFKEKKLRDHLSLQWRFQLLGDGSFASNLSHSLFDPEMESGERKSGVMRSGVHTGLRLGNRDNWPPASSELRLVLMGLLGDCYFSEEGQNKSDTTQTQRDTELPGDLSFSIRELTEEEVLLCKDPSAIEALDFLRLQYKPPEAINVLITTQSLEKYDLLFKHLLRLLRMVSVVKGLVRDSTSRGSLSGDTRNVFQRFRVDAQHFILAFSDYCFQVGIGSTWSRFQDTLANIEQCLDRGDIDGTIETAHSVSRLHDYHEDMLDQMLFALFLSKRHAPAAQLLKNIFSTILAFSPLSQADGMSGLRHESEGTVLHLYSSFRKQVSTFVGYLRSLDPGKGSSKSMGKSAVFFSSPTDTTNPFEHLRVRLEMRKYY
ncbi:hypothetical protein N7495_002519 [Penicillium taxi]|uniref:uncharacterized protein n=1 Tax=Penicillium taxi TaxID=168475 RepID=UPI0025456256|nr:uncharacterized protein N7495_002519 [Penicillium taxi]KAJ5901991.1 hypothetical protein N7495_002519 [Penicillium taxi]